MVMCKGGHDFVYSRMMYTGQVPWNFPYAKTIMSDLQKGNSDALPIADTWTFCESGTKLSGNDSGTSVGLFSFSNNGTLKYIGFPSASTLSWRLTASADTADWAKTEMSAIPTVSGMIGMKTELAFPAGIWKIEHVYMHVSVFRNVFFYRCHRRILPAYTFHHISTWSDYAIHTVGSDNEPTYKTRVRIFFCWISSFPGISTAIFVHWAVLLIRECFRFLVIIS